MNNLYYYFFPVKDDDWIFEEPPVTQENLYSILRNV